MTPYQNHGASCDTTDEGEEQEKQEDSSEKSVNYLENPRSDEAVIFTDLEEQDDRERHQLRRTKGTQSSKAFDYGISTEGQEGRPEGFRTWGGGPNVHGGEIDDLNGSEIEGDYEGEGWWPGSGGPVATVKLVLEANLGVITKAWPLLQPLKSMRAEVSEATQVPLQYLQLTLRGQSLEDDSNLARAGVEANETVQIGVSSRNPNSHPLVLLQPPVASPISTPDVITVIVIDADGGEREIVVEVEWSGSKKPWLGGFRHKVSGILYHNASSQTLALSRTRQIAQMSRGTQTVKTRSCGTQTLRNVSTQTTSIHPSVVSPDSTFITPKEYSPAFRYDLKQVMVLQRMVRGWLARRKLQHLRREKSSMMADSSPEAANEEKSSHISSSSSEQSCERNNDNHSKGWRGPVPMAELYARLENWRKTQVSQINSSLHGKSRKRALVALLDKETELLRSLETHRSLRSARKRNSAITRFLEEVSRAQVWEVAGESGGVEVETPETQPVRDLAALANSLQQDATKHLRLQQLNALATTVEHFHPTRGDLVAAERSGQELVTLARRGTHLLARGTSDARLKGLRKRLHTLIISYLHQVQGRELTSIVPPRTIRAAGGKPVLATGRS